MPALREILDRFRAAGPPGAAAPAAVPADRRSALLDEVAPVFAASAPTRGGPDPGGPGSCGGRQGPRRGRRPQGAVDLTRRRLRALEHHRIPTLREALTLALTRVEEMEAADAVLRRWVVEQRDR